MELKQFAKTIDIQEEIISSKGDDTDFELLKKKFEEMRDTGRWSNLRDLKREFMRRRANQSLIDRMGKDKVSSTIERLYNRK